MTVNLASNADGECDVAFGLSDQDITYISAAGTGQTSDPYPSQYENDRFTFQYGGAGDSPNSLTISLYCIGTNTSATYTIDNISLDGPSCC